MLWNGKERGKSKVKGISEQPPTIQDMIDQKHPENVEYFNNLGSMVAKHCMQDVRVKRNPELT